MDAAKHPAMQKTSSTTENCSVQDVNIVKIEKPFYVGNRILEWIAIPFSRGSSRPRNWTQVSYTAGRFCTIWNAREAHETPIGKNYLLTTYINHNLWL